MFLDYGAYSHQGKVRKRNEDYYFIPDSKYPFNNLAMVADGLGGHNAGDMASQMVVQYILDYFNDRLDTIKTLDDAKDIIYESIENSNKKVYEYSKTAQVYSGMGSTLTLVYFFDNKACIGHVGDSRCYMIRNGSVKQITKDHSLVQELLENGSITQDQVQHHPQKNVITRALGTEEYVDIDYYEIDLDDNDIILLCTDGLVNHVDIKQNIDILASSNYLNDIAAILGEKALDGGGTDNITVVIVKYSDAAEKR